MIETLMLRGFLIHAYICLWKQLSSLYADTLLLSLKIETIYVIIV